MKACNEMIERTLVLVQQMMRMADEGDNVRDDDGCGILYGVLRDSAYKIRKLAEAERLKHIRSGKWG